VVVVNNFNNNLYIRGLVFNTKSHMAVIGSIRKRGTLLLVFVGVSMLAFVLGDLFNRMGPAPDNTVIEVGNSNVSYDEFANYYNYLKSTQSIIRGLDITDESELMEISNLTLRYFLEELVFKPEYANALLKTTNEEEVDALIGMTVHPYIRQFFTDPETGRFSQELATNYDRQFAMDIEEIPAENREAFAQARIQWKQMQDQVMDERRQNKYNNLVRRSLYVTTLEAKFQFNIGAEQLNVNYIFNPYTSIEDTTISFTDNDLKSHFRKYGYRFRQPEMVQTQYVVFNAIPTPVDSADLYNQLVMVIDEFRNTDDDTLFVIRNTDNKTMDPSYFKAGQMGLTLDTMLFAAPVGRVVGPVVADGNFVIAKKMAEKDEPDSLFARHILFIPQTQEELTEMQARRDSVIEALRSGANFYDLQAQFSMDEAAKNDSGKVGWISRSNTSIDRFFLDSAFTSPKAGSYVGATSMSGLHVIYIERATTPVRNVLIGQVTREIRPSKATSEDAFNRATEFAIGYRDSNIDPVRYFTDARRQGRMIREEQIGREARGISNYPGSSEVTRWALEAKAGTVSPVFSLDRAYVVALVVNRRGMNPEWSDIREDLIRDFRRHKKYEMMADAMKAAGSGDLNSIAGSLNLPVRNTLSLTINGFLDAAGAEPIVIGRMFGSEPGVLSGPHRGSSGVFMFVVESKNPAETLPDYSQNRMILNSQVQSVFAQNAVEGLMQAYKVVDRRYRFDGF
jgi:peptidyl-prolyl cis-trans isomerase D